MDSEWDSTKEYYSYSGDVIRTQGNLLYINGELSNGYTFRGINSENGIEFVKVWYFQNRENELDLQESFDYDPFILWLKNKNNVNVSGDYLNTQTVIIEGASNVSTNSLIKKIEYLEGTNDIVIPNITTRAKSNMTILPLNVFTFKTRLQEVILPELTTIAGEIGGQNRNGFFECSNLKRISFPKLQRIEDGRDFSLAFSLVISVELPESVRYVGSYAFANNQSIVLNCPKATFNDLWCYRAPNSFTMCSNWEASINIKTAAANWSLQNFIDLLSNKDRLKNVGFDIADNNGDADYDSVTGKYVVNSEKTGAYQTKRYITIPQNILSSLDSETLDAAFQKGWKVQGG